MFLGTYLLIQCQSDSTLSHHHHQVSSQPTKALKFCPTEKWKLVRSVLFTTLLTLGQYYSTNTALWTLFCSFFFVLFFALYFSFMWLCSCMRIPWKYSHLNKLTQAQLTSLCHCNEGWHISRQDKTLSCTLWLDERHVRDINWLTDRGRKVYSQSEFTMKLVTRFHVQCNLHKLLFLSPFSQHPGTTLLLSQCAWMIHLKVYSIRECKLFSNVWKIISHRERNFIGIIHHLAQWYQCELVCV